MPTRSKPDHENPEWTADRMKRAMRFRDLPPELQAVLAPTKRRGQQLAPKKQPVSIRLSSDVYTALKATGSGWQTRVDETLRKKFLPAKVRTAQTSS